MLKFILLFLLALFFLGCTDVTSNSTEKKKLTISRAPVSGEPVSALGQFSIAFSDALDAKSISSDSVYLEINYGTETVTLSSSLELSVDGKTITLIPDLYLENTSNYNFVVTTDVSTLEGSSLNQNYIFSFSTLSDGQNDNTALAFVGIKPSDAKTGVPSITEISIGFDKFLAPVESTNTFMRVDFNGTAISGTMRYFNSVATFVPSAALENNTTYTVTLDATPTDLYGNSYTGVSSWSFTTATTTADVRINEGYKEFNSLNLSKESSKIIVAGTLTSPKFIVGHNDGLSILSLNTQEIVPTLELKGSVSIASKVTDILRISANSKVYIAVATKSDGVYLYEDNNTSVLTFLSKSTASLEITSLSSYLDNLYAVGPAFGLEHFLIETDGTLTSLYADTNVSKVTPLYIDTYKALSSSLVIGVSDYSNGIRVYDENLSLQSLGSLDGYTKRLLAGTSFLVENTIGIVNEVNATGGVLTQNIVELISPIYEIKEGLYGLECVFQSHGLFINDLTNNTVDLLQSSVEIVSSTMYTDEVSVYVRLLLGIDGSIHLYNMVKDIDSPTFTSIPLNYDGSYSNVTDVNITFSEYIDESSFVKNDFVYLDDLNVSVDFTMSITHGTTTNETLVILSPISTAQTCDVVSGGNACTVNIPNNLSDLLGNLVSPNQSIVFSNANSGA